MENMDYINRTLALRYLECPDVSIIGENELEECEKLIAAAAQPRFCYARYNIGDLELEGADVRRHLDGCKSVILFAATVGDGVDKAIRRASIMGISRGMMCDAVASAMIERYCEHCDELLSAQFPDEYLTWRFSPGYGDFPLSYQRSLIELLDAGKKIGLFLTDSMLMLPQKSITAVIGVSDRPIERAKMGCAICSMRDVCRFRKEGRHCEA